jgi:large subunit ribosomal protein L10
MNARTLNELYDVFLMSLSKSTISVSRALRSVPSAAPIRPAFVATQRTCKFCYRWHTSAHPFQSTLMTYSFCVSDATAAATSAKAHPARRTYLHNKYTTLLNDNRIALILQFNNLNVKELTALRQELIQLSAATKLTVVRSGVFASVLRGTRFANLDPLVMGPTCVLSTNGSDAEHPTLINDIVTIINKNKKLMLIGGKMDETLLNLEGVEKVSSIAGITSVQSELLGVLQSPARQLLGLLDRRYVL